jgi:hypothetical protein
MDLRRGKKGESWIKAAEMRLLISMKRCTKEDGIKNESVRAEL